MKIRAYHATDAIALARLYVRSVEQIGRRDYSAQQVAAWASLGPSPDRLHELSRSRTRLVAIDGSDQPMAFVDLEQDGHIDLLYCAPEAAGQGVASALYDALEGIALERGMRRLYAEASLDEAILLGDRVILMTAHPGHLLATFAIDIERPRTIDTMNTPAFAALRGQIWDQLGKEVRRAMEMQQ